MKNFKEHFYENALFLCTKSNLFMLFLKNNIVFYEI